MAHLIDKDALVAWAKETYLCENASMTRKVCYKQLLEHLDTLETKEIDLDKEIVDGWKTIHNAGNEIPFDTFNGIAKHFFERGMRFSAVGSDYIEGVRGYCETTTK